MWKLLLFILAILIPVNSLDNGLALTPPMGWLSWERYRCEIDCEKNPNECINEKLFKDVADLMVSGGYKDAGYEYVIIDDCWLEKERDENGNLVPDKKRFPNGMKPLAAYIHSKGLKFGIYEDYGTHTCAGYPGVQGHLEQDARTLASWDVDYIKLDGCYSNASEQEQGTREFSEYLNATGRKIFLSCEFPLNEYNVGLPTNFSRAFEYCNSWRNFCDVQDSWVTILNILEHYAKTQNEFQPHSKPGGWTDPDMLDIGNFGLSYEQSRAQMAIWAIMASPLIMSTDLRNIKPAYKAILLNKDVIAINQDPLGITGLRVHSNDSIDIYTRPITPVVNGSYSYAIAVLNRRDDGTPYARKFKLSDIGLDHELGYTIKNVYDPTKEVIHRDGYVWVRVNPSGVVLLKATVNKKEGGEDDDDDGDGGVSTILPLNMYYILTYSLFVCIFTMHSVKF